MDFRIYDILNGTVGGVSKDVLMSVISEIIDDETVVNYLAEEGHTITLNFKADIQEGQFVTVAILVNGEWVVVENIMVLEDGTIDVTLDCLGTIAIFVTNPEEQAA